ncbi:protein PLASTID MOVEMENT IMPAIRED 1-RELATED 1 isoform X2 [Cynara cardunculus var. scolymus]|uniref:protein PLASTID MOVEMENT IMPAIRED 1-RELATED 1 isoform X2 n=1 Tax=Cynara cardunculus var. scolymus TaxID=59895 RepID=UPI000D62740B|nr:protein PLASTID MOVEMENT IMPAIRED 1-RELATED 1 isoform X2 [Cynara cardunculus var. scolymus]
MSRYEIKKTSGQDSRHGAFLNDISDLSKAMYEDKTHSRGVNSTASSRSKSIVRPQLPETKSKAKANEDRFLKDKKSIWSWNTLKSFTHVRNKRFNCCFSLQVHSIEGLPPSFDDLTLCVKWKRRDGELSTRPAPVLHGVAEFEQLLTNTCSVYGSRSGPHHSAKYEAKHFLLYASVFGDPELDLGKHRVDLTRLLPLTLEELEDEKSSGKWTTTYRLSGKAKGASINVSFGYSVVGNSPSEPTRHNSIGIVKSPGKASGQSQIHRRESLPLISSSLRHSVEDIKDLHEVLPISKPELSESVTILYKKFEEEKSIISVDYGTQRDVQVVPFEPSNADSESPGPDRSNIVSEFSVLDQGIEFPMEEELKAEQDKRDREEGIFNGFDCSDRPNLHPESLLEKKSESQKEECVVTESNTTEQHFDDKESLLKELESALNSVADMVKEDSDSQEETEYLKEHGGGKEIDSVVCSREAGFGYEESENLDQETYMELKIGYKEKGKSLKLDYATEAVADDFLNMLGIEHSPFSMSSESESNSPRERLLRKFEKDSLANGSSLFNFNVDDDEAGFGDDSPSASLWGPIPEEFNTSSMLHASEDMLKSGIQEAQNKTKASVLEDLETEALMREWGLNEKVFQRSPSNTAGGLGSPVGLSPEEPLELPPLGEGLGPFVQTSNGGFLRSMDPEIFRNAKSGGNLIMQANKLMPLEDISGKTMQQIAWEATPTLEAPERQASLQQEAAVGQVAPDHPNIQSSGRRSRKYEMGVADPEYASLEDLAPLAMNKIEALSIEGLRIQSGMSDKDAPSNISPQSIGEISALEGKRINFNGSLGLEGTGGLQLMNIKNSIDGGGDDDIDGIMGLSVTLDEWMRLDSGEMEDGDEMSERTSRILAAHHASDLMRARRGKGSKKGGLLGNNFTVALMVQLRDPLRNFEPVGTPMLALVQVERVFVPPKQKIPSSIYALWKKPEEEEKDEVQEEMKVKVEEEKIPVEESVSVPQFKITEVHVAGVKTEPSKKQIWGSNTKQQQAGSRWLVANGMGKKNAKHPLMKSKAAGASDKSSSGSLWSISSKGKKGSMKVDPPVRNPNVILPNETVKLLSGVGFV